MYRYFIQPQLDKFNNSLIGYELLIRYRDPATNTWSLPVNFGAVPTDVQINLLTATAKQLAPKFESISLNFNCDQFLNQPLVNAVIATQATLFPLKFIVEVTEETTVNPPTANAVLAQVQHLKRHGLQFSLDDVGTGQNVYEPIEPLLGYVDEIKFALQNFRAANRTAEIPSALKFWQQIAQQYHLRLIVEGIETAREDALADDLGIRFRQGFYYGKPHLFKLA